MTPKCPHCGSIIYSRRHELCGVCGQRLPQELLFTPAEREVVERELAEATRREKKAHTELVEEIARENRVIGGYNYGSFPNQSKYPIINFLSWLFGRPYW